MGDEGLEKRRRTTSMCEGDAELPISRESLACATIIEEVGARPMAMEGEEDLEPKVCQV